MGDSLGVGDPQTIFLFYRVACQQLQSGEKGRWGLLVFTYPERALPTRDAAISSQVMALDLSRFSIQQRRLVSCKHPTFPAYESY